MPPQFLLFLVCLLQHARHANSQRPQLQTCTGTILRFPPPSKGDCLTSWAGQRGEEKLYPEDFDDILNRVQIYRCPSRDKRVIISNGVPNHSVILQNRNGPCEFHWVVEMPLNPSVADRRTEIPIRGMIAMALNGVPAYGAQENDYLNAVEGTMGVQGAKYWYGHAGPNSAWHVHNPKMGRELESHETLLGYAMDGFPIYGHLEDDSVLDPCNGVTSEDSTYQYHVRTLEQVDGSLEYCNNNSPETNWNYVLGCYAGSVDDTRIFDSTTYSLDDDCFIDESGPENTAAEIPSQVGETEEAPTSLTEKDDSSIPKRPNIIIMQPDDLPFYDTWGPPPNNPSTPDQSHDLPNYGLPHIESLRLNGLQMMQAYTTSPVCGTSRFSTITSRYPSRALSNDEGGDAPPIVKVPTTKLQGDDCIKNNLAVQFRDNGYRTAMIGKWHLSYINRATYTYDGAVNTVKECGFDIVEGLYIENFAQGGFNNYHDGSFSHNMEWITHEAIKVVKENPEEPFFMYFNPTVPHGFQSVRSALTEFSCKDTPAGTLSSDPIIPGMTDGGDCTGYRQTIFDRAEDDGDLGAIWIDDSVGAILRSLEDIGALEDTIFLFQADHGVDPKGALYEGGIRIPQFIHYPAVISAGMQFDSPVSVIDAGASMLDYAGILPSYEIDGLSWKEAISGEDSGASWGDRCLYFELERDRSLICGCYKYLNIFEQSELVSTTYIRGNRKGLSNDEINLFDLCGGSDDYVTEIKGNNMEASNSNLIGGEPSKASDLGKLLDCHLERIEAEEFSPCQSSSGTESNEISASQSRVLNTFYFVSAVFTAHGLRFC